MATEARDLGVDMGVYVLPPGPLLATADGDLQRRVECESGLRWQSQHLLDLNAVTLCHPGRSARPEHASHDEMPTPEGQGVYHPPAELPPLSALRRRKLPREVVWIELRRHGMVPIPLGVGPLYAIGPRRGSPSSQYGELCVKIHRQLRAIADHEDGATLPDDGDIERLQWLALSATHHLTWELYWHMAPWDDDEAEQLLTATWGLDPKLVPDADPTSPASASGESEAAC